MSEDDDTLKRIILSQFVQDSIENPDRHWSENYTQKEINDLREYLKGHNIKIPRIPDDNRKNDVVKVMVRAWAAIETLNCVGHLTGFDNEHQVKKAKQSRFSNIDVVSESEIKKKKKGGK